MKKDYMGAAKRSRTLDSNPRASNQTPFQFTRVDVDSKCVEGSDEEQIDVTLQQIELDCNPQEADSEEQINTYKKYLEAFAAIPVPSEYDRKVLDYLQTKINELTNLLSPKPVKRPRPYPEFREKYRLTDPKMGFHTFYSSHLKPVNIRHSRCSSYISTNKKQYPDTEVGTTYKSIIEALKKERVTDREIADILLTDGIDKLKDPNAQRAAIMLIGIVYLAEEWRKQGAVKVFRAILRLIESGKKTLEDIKKDYQFVKSAQAGREQVQRLWGVMKGHIELSSLDERDRQIYDALSDMEDGDMESDTEMRKRKNSEYKGKRLRLN